MVIRFRYTLTIPQISMFHTISRPETKNQLLIFMLFQTFHCFIDFIFSAPRGRFLLLYTSQTATSSMFTALTHIFLPTVKKISTLDCSKVPILRLMILLLFDKKLKNGLLLYRILCTVLIFFQYSMSSTPFS